MVIMVAQITGEQDAYKIICYRIYLEPKDLIEHYENENAKVDDLIGDPIFIEG